MKIIHQVIIFLFSLLLITVVSTAGEVEPPQPPPEPFVGGYTPIKNLNDPHVIEVAHFAVEENNKQDNAHMLKFLSIFKGWSQVVAGINYRLIITAKPVCRKAVVQRYEAVVYEIPWKNSMNLTSFKLIK